MPTRRRKKRMLHWSLLGVLLAAVIAVVWLLTIPAPIESWLQERVLQALREHYHADVQLQNLRVTLIPSFRATADDFLLPNRGGPDLPPLITVTHLTAQGGLLELLRTPVHISWVKLDGLTIRVIPKRDSATGSPASPSVTCISLISSSTRSRPTQPRSTSSAKIQARSRWSGTSASFGCAAPALASR